ncbi:hypothetical protein [Oceanobacillus jeddahense]|uniref:Cytochrome P450 n=1 Tax=Oceanobacillus jeddahense TaxID=1462527 RepID=A0ABY5JM13_9BACI|nr:hypothetical protein [Oceanobacillus jeddahense]UUI01340.1 hypothetical protein NP439_14880 [Oceanobacillus jeddahense]
MMRMIFVMAMILSIFIIFIKWRYRILNSLLNWKPGRKFLVPLIGNVILSKKKKETV